MNHWTFKAKCFISFLAYKWKLHCVDPCLILIFFVFFCLRWRFPPYPDNLQYHTMILLRPMIIVGDARFEPGTSAPEVYQWATTSHHEPPHVKPFSLSFYRFWEQLKDKIKAIIDFKIKAISTKREKEDEERPWYDLTPVYMLILKSTAGIAYSNDDIFIRIFNLYCMLHVFPPEAFERWSLVQLNLMNCLENIS